MPLLYCKNMFFQLISQKSNYCIRLHDAIYHCKSQLVGQVSKTPLVQRMHRKKGFLGASKFFTSRSPFLLCMYTEYNAPFSRDTDYNFTPILMKLRILIIQFRLGRSKRNLEFKIFNYLLNNYRQIISESKKINLYYITHFFGNFF